MLPRWLVTIILMAAVVPAGYAQDELQTVRVLIPVQVSTLAGAGSSLWRTEAYAYSGADDFVWHVPPVQCFSTCGYVGYFSPRTGLLANYWNNWAPTFFVKIQKEFADRVWINIGAFDAARMGASLGAEIPAVREDDFTGESLQLLNIWTGDAMRSRLRVYGLPDTPSPSSVVIQYWELGHDARMLGEDTLLLTRRPTEQFEIEFPDYAELAIPHFGEKPVRIEVTPVAPSAKIWAFASMTHNETHFVTIVSPYPAAN